MKIAIFSTPVSFGGGEKQLVILLKELQKHHIDLIVFNLARAQEFETALLQNNIKFISIGKDLGFSPRFTEYVIYFFEILPLIIFNPKFKEVFFNYDILWARGFPANAILALGKMIFKNKKCKLVYSHHAEKHYKGKILRLLNLFILKKFDIIIGVSSLVVKSLRLIFPEISEKIILIPNCIDLSQFSINVPKEKLRENLGLPRDDILGIYPARFSKSKNHLFLIKLLQEIENNNFKILLLGEGETKELFFKMIKDLGLTDRIIYRGFVRQEILIQYLFACDFCVFPSLAEGFSNAILEAMATGLPVVMFKNIWTEEYGKNVIVCEDEVEFIEKTKKLVFDPDYRKKLGIACKNDIKHLSPEEIANKYLEVFKRLV
jgi:glycosyltransferase involved in cell wall biosynthesis